MRDLMQNRVAHFINPIEKRQMPRQCNSAIRVIAFSKSAPGMIKLKPPTDQRMPANQFAGEIGRFVEIHWEAGDR